MKLVASKCGRIFRGLWRTIHRKGGKGKWNTILQMSIQAGILIIGIVLIRALGMNKLPKKSFLILWDIVLIKLLVPLSFPAKWNILTFFNELQKDVGKTSASVQAEINIALADFRILPLEQLIASKTTISSSLMISVWIAGMVVFGVVFSAFIFKDYQELRFSIPVTNTPTIVEWQSKHTLYRPLRILQSDRITTPLAVGIISPRIILPKTMDINNTQSISYVLTHEYFHLRRFDMLRKVFILCAVCVHWFNPLVWVMSILLNRDLEMTCDEEVLKHFGANKTTKKEYAYALIEIAEARNAYSPIRSYFSTNSAEERIISIMKYKKASCLSVAMAALLLVCFTNIFVAFACEAPLQTNYAEPYSPAAPLEVAQPGQTVKGKPPRAAVRCTLDGPLPAVQEYRRRRGIYHHRAHPKRGALTSGQSVQKRGRVTSPSPFSCPALPVRAAVSLSTRPAAP